MEEWVAVGIILILIVGFLGNIGYVYVAHFSFENNKVETFLEKEYMAPFPFIYLSGSKGEDLGNLEIETMITNEKNVSIFNSTHVFPSDIKWAFIKMPHYFLSFNEPYDDYTIILRIPDKNFEEVYDWQLNKVKSK